MGSNGKIRSRNVLFLEDQIVCDAEKSDKSQSSPEISIILTSVSLPVVHDDNGGAEENTNDDLVKPVEQAPSELPSPPVEPELRRFNRERRPSTRYPPHEYVILTDEGDSKSFKESISHSHKNEWVKATQEEIKSLNENNTYNLVKFLK